MVVFWMVAIAGLQGKKAWRSVQTGYEKYLVGFHRHARHTCGTPLHDQEFISSVAGNGPREESTKPSSALHTMASVHCYKARCSLHQIMCATPFTTR